MGRKDAADTEYVGVKGYTSDRPLAIKGRSFLRYSPISASFEPQNGQKPITKCALPMLR